MLMIKIIIFLALFPFANISAYKFSATECSSSDINCNVETEVVGETVTDCSDPSVNNDTRSVADTSEEKTPSEEEEQSNQTVRK